MRHVRTFEESLLRTIGSHEITTIGTQKERTLHATLKDYFSTSKENVEVKIGPYYADILEGNEIIEIQTRRLDRLKEKVDYYLNAGFDVTIVYPLAKNKTIHRLDPKTGEIVESRKSPKHATALDSLYEICGLLNYLSNPHLRFQIVLLDMDEYFQKTEKTKARRRTSPRLERIPSALKEEYVLSRKEDYTNLLPKSLPAEFTLKEFGKEAKIPKEAYARAISVLLRVGAIYKSGKRRNAFLYSISEDTL